MVAHSNVSIVNYSIPQGATLQKKRLHQLIDSGKLAGFALAYLGPLDDRLPRFPLGLPKRRVVYKYPTRFSPMSVEDIDHMVLRGDFSLGGCPRTRKIIGF